MVSGKEGMSSACSEFIQNAWRKELCANCQHSRAEHSGGDGEKHDTGGGQDSSTTAGTSGSQAPHPQRQDTDSPKPAKRNSLMAKSWTAHETPEAHEIETHENDDAKWEAMCRPAVDHNYEAIDELTNDFERNDSKETDMARKTKSLKIGEGSRQLRDENERVSVTLPRDSKSRSRSKSPLPAPKPKVIPVKGSRDNASGSPKLKTKIVLTETKRDVLNSDKSKSSSIGDSKSAINDNKTQKSGERTKPYKVNFVTSQPIVIAEDGGYDNLIPDAEEHITESEDEIKEILTFSDQEREWALLALKNTIWNSHINDLKDETGKLRPTQSKEFEDIELESLWKPDRFANVKDFIAFPSQTVYGTYPLRTKSGKSSIDTILDGSSLETIEETYESFLKYGFGDNKETEIGAKLDRLIANEVDLSDASYDDPWGDKFGFDTESDMNLLDEIKGEIDLDSSSAGMALVDLLNDVLSKYSTGTPSETDSVKNMDNFYEETEDLSQKETKVGKKVKKETKNKEIPSELEAKVVTLAASLRLKQRAKRHAPRPPSCPPAPPVSPGEQAKASDKPKTPSEQLELRAAQSKEPLFKMVPVGKPIGNSPVAQAQSSPMPRKLESDSSLESVECKIKEDKEKQKRGGISGFFRNFLRRSKGSETDVSNSVENNGTSSSQISLQSEQKVKTEKENSSSKNDEKSDGSPQNKSKAVPGRSVSPKPPGKPPDKPLDKPKTVTSKENEKLNMDDQAESVKSASNKPNESADVKSMQKEENDLESKDTSQADNKSKPRSPSSSLNSSTKSTSSGEKDHPSPSSKSKVAPALPTVAPRQLLESKETAPKQSSEGKESTASKEKDTPSVPAIGPRQLSDSNLQPPKPRKRGGSETGQTRSRPRTRDMTPNVPPPKPPHEASHSKLSEAPHGGPTKPPIEAPSVPPPKPPLAAKPKPALQNQAGDGDKAAAKPPPHHGERMTISPSRNERASSTSSLEDDSTRSRGARDTRSKMDPAVLRKRAKSPKRFHAPLVPRSSLPNVLTDSNTSVTSSGGQSAEPKQLSFAKELEQKLQKEVAHVGEVKKMSAPPPPSPTSKVVPEPNDSQKHSQTNSPKDVKKETQRVLKESEKMKQNDEIISTTVKEETESLQEQEIDETKVAPVEHIEKIELPKAASSSRKSFLGKLNRKNRPPQAQSVKRTKSITESSVAGDLHLKKIDLKDISGPVLITEMSSNKVVNRRNTITIGDDSSFLSGGSTSSGSTGEKSEMSPQGSLENMYELIAAEAPPPPGSANEKQSSLRPPSITSLGIEGYLEPVRSNSGAVVNTSEPVKPNIAESSSKDSVAMDSKMAANMAASCHADILSVNKSSLSKESESTDKSVDVKDIDALETLDISDERRLLLANQPIYEEINGYGKLDQADGGSTENYTHYPPDSRPILNGDPQLCSNIENSNLNVDNSQARISPSLNSKDSFSSESDLSSANNSLSRNPRPIPRRRPRQSMGVGFEQYVAMNRPSVAVFLNEDQLREILSKLTAMNLQTLRELYTQHEKTFTKDSVHLGAAGPLKWIDFDIYGKPVHASEQCVVYNAKLKQGQSACQIMLLHSRPEMMTANHPSLLKPTCIFTDSVHYSYLTEDFIRTSQLQTALNQSNSAKCYIVVGLFDITESVTHHLSSLQSLCENQKEFLRKILFFTLQLLSAISYCLEQGHPLAEADFRDICLISNPYCLGEIVAFLPQLRSPENQQIDTVCYFLEKFLDDMCIKCEANKVLDDDAYAYYAGIQKIISMLQSGTAECLPVVRSYTEFLLWGPQDSDLQFSEDRTSNLEPKLSMWLENQRTSLIHDFAKRTQSGTRCRIEDFYNMKFLLKASSSSLAECVRCHAAS